MIPPIGSQIAAASLGLVPQAGEHPVAPVSPAAQGTASQGFNAGRDDASMRQYPKPTQSSLDKALASVNDSLKAWSTGMRFEMDEDAQRLVVSIVDSATGDVLRTIPSDAVLRVAKMIVQLQGAGVDTQA